jgi:hypothetical protein
MRTKRCKSSTERETMVIQKCDTLLSESVEFRMTRHVYFVKLSPQNNTVTTHQN